jgi:hypothetical protein
VSTAPVLVGHYLADHSRRPLNLALLIVVPVLFVGLSSSAIADFARALGVGDEAAALGSVSASWAAAFLAGVAGFFLVHDSRGPDRRLAGAGMSSSTIAVARMTTGLLLALVASMASLATLAVLAGVADPARTVAGTLLTAVIYLALGVTVGTLVRSDVNGSLLVIFVWMLDVFLGPAMAGGDLILTRAFPSHFVTLMMLDSTSGHGGPLPDPAWALLWAAAATLAAGGLFVRNTAPPRWRARPRVAVPRSFQRVLAGFRYGFTEYRRDIAMWVMLVAVPVLFITLSFYRTPDMPSPVALVEGGASTVRLISMADIHGALMVPITVGFLAGLAGLFMVCGSLEADRRLVLAGFQPIEALASRMGVIAAAALLVTVVSLAVTALDFEPRQWGWFAIGNTIVGLTYGLIGVFAGVAFGRLGGLYVMFLIPFLDVGLAQNVMFSAAPPAWGVLLPAHGAVRIIVDAAFTDGADVAVDLVLALGWLAVIALLAAALFHRIATARPR